MINVHSEEYILGQNIRNCRMKKKWTQKQLAIAVDVDLVLCQDLVQVKMRFSPS